MPDAPINRHMIGLHGERIVTMFQLPQTMSKREALELAAWLVALADDGNEFGPILQAIRES